MLDRLANPTSISTAHVRTTKLAHFWDPIAASVLFGNLRWQDEKKCPRCKSKYVKAVNSGFSRDLSRCIDCQYMFNALAGTYFQGSKIGLYRYFQMFTIFSFSNGEVCSNDISSVMLFSQKTSALQLERIKSLEIECKFTVFDQSKYEIEDDGIEDFLPDSSSVNFHEYCRKHSICVNEAMFIDYLCRVMAVKSPTEPVEFVKKGYANYATGPL